LSSLDEKRFALQRETVERAAVKLIEEFEKKFYERQARVT